VSQPDPVADLPLFSWTEDRYLRTKGGGKLKRWGSVRDACRLLFDCDRKVIYDLLDAGLIEGRKLRPHRPNSHWKVDLLSVWEYRERQRKT
jgi:hypothetical protein